MMAFSSLSYPFTSSLAADLLGRYSANASDISTWSETHTSGYQICRMFPSIEHKLFLYTKRILDLNANINRVDQGRTECRKPFDFASTSGKILYRSMHRQSGCELCRKELRDGNVSSRAGLSAGSRDNTMCERFEIVARRREHKWRVIEKVQLCSAPCLRSLGTQAVFQLASRLSEDVREVWKALSVYLNITRTNEPFPRLTWAILS